MNIDELLNAAKTAKGLESDYALAEALETNRASVSNWRHGKHLPNAVMCEKLAVFSGIPLHRVLGIVGEARAVSAAEKRVWRKLAAAMFVSLVAVATPAMARDFPTNGHTHSIHYAKSTMCPPGTGTAATGRNCRSRGHRSL